MARGLNQNWHENAIPRLHVILDWVYYIPLRDPQQLDHFWPTLFF